MRRVAYLRDFIRHYLKLLIESAIRIIERPMKKNCVERSIKNLMCQRMGLQLLAYNFWVLI